MSVDNDSWIKDKSSLGEFKRIIELRAALKCLIEAAEKGRPRELLDAALSKARAALKNPNGYMHEKARPAREDFHGAMDGGKGRGS